MAWTQLDPRPHFPENSHTVTVSGLALPSVAVLVEDRHAVRGREVEPAGGEVTQVRPALKALTEPGGNPEEGDKNLLFKSTLVLVGHCLCKPTGQGVSSQPV